MESKICGCISVPVSRWRYFRVRDEWAPANLRGVAVGVIDGHALTRVSGTVVSLATWNIRRAITKDWVMVQISILKGLMWTTTHSGCALHAACSVPFFFLWFHRSPRSFTFYITSTRSRDVIFTISLPTAEFDWRHRHLTNSPAPMKKLHVSSSAAFPRPCRFRERWSSRRGKKGKGKKRNCCYFAFGSGVWTEPCKFDRTSEAEKDYVRVPFHAA